MVMMHRRDNQSQVTVNECTGTDQLDRLLALDKS